MRDLLLTLAVGAAVAAMAVAYDYGRIRYWVGGYEVQVTTVHGSPRPLREAAVATLLRSQWVDMGGNSDYVESWRPVPVSDGGSFVVWVKCVGRDSGLGRPLGYSRPDVLVLRVDYADGGRWVGVSDLPTADGDRVMAVQVP